MRVLFLLLLSFVSGKEEGLIPTGVLGFTLFFHKFSALGQLLNFVNWA